ncbi:helix-turn-helix transcriptional regulator [Gordonia sp. TBRC 11910]|uniref:Helix-turn-helix transcriptional regulator n=1 Tax=Gordonia asplenii TaxID=2725283 RepID=A0A848KPM6_9ACTN|nr:helix-turn-helix transcriptional regulator [Gordonia asplenii]NMO00280.1 helix-turn-helix transcriptional regulator [Gordonia asplenii]
MAREPSGLYFEVRTCESRRPAIADIDEFSQTVGAIYESAINPATWISALERISALFNATATSLISGRGPSRTLLASTSSAEVQSAYRGHFHQLDYVTESVEQAPVGLIRTGTTLVAPGSDSEFGHDFLRRFDLRTGLFVPLHGDPSPVSLLIAGPQANRESESADAIRTGDRLTVHLRHALRTQHALADLHATRTLTADVIDTARHGIIIVRADLQCMQMNHAAEHIVAAGDGLRVHAGRLTAHRSTTDQRLTARLHAATDPADRVGASMICERSTGDRPYVVHIVPISPHDAATTWDHTTITTFALVVLVNPDRIPQPSSALLIELFGLTTAEADVALRVLAGDGLAPIADDLHISTATVKTHLQRIFTKTGTHRQAELVRLLLTILP